ncbi:MAG: cell division protein FtsZ [bacterium]
MPEIKPEIETFAKIKVVGVGGSGCSAVNRMIASKIKGVEFIAMNTDVQALQHNNAKIKLHLGQMTTKGLGAGMNPEVGAQAAEESINEVRDLLKGADMVFVTCGLGGGTGTGAAPRIAAVAKELGALVVAIVTKPFKFEGKQRSEIAERGYQELAQRVDTIITIQNDKILQNVDKKTGFTEGFGLADEVLRQSIQGVSEIITGYGDVNVDFADVKAIMKDAGTALMGIGEVAGDNRAVMAAKKAISSPLLDLSIDGAKGVLYIISASASLTMDEVNEASLIITENADPNAKVIFGVVIDESLKDKIRITVVATGFGDKKTPNAFSQPVKNTFTVRPVVTDKPLEPRGNVQSAGVAHYEEEKPRSTGFANNSGSNVVNHPMHQPISSHNLVKPQSSYVIPSAEEEMETPSIFKKRGLTSRYVPGQPINLEESEDEESEDNKPQVGFTGHSVESVAGSPFDMNTNDNEDLEMPTFLKKKMK